MNILSTKERKTEWNVNGPMYKDRHKKIIWVFVFTSKHQSKPIITNWLSCNICRIAYSSILCDWFPAAFSTKYHKTWINDSFCKL